MMKQLKYGTACLLVLAAACGDDSDAFYTAVYPVVRVEAEITLPAPEPGPTDPTDPTKPTEPGNVSTGESSHIVWFGAIAVIALAAALLTVYKKTTKAQS